MSEAEPRSASGAGSVAIVVATPGDALALLAAERPGAVVDIVCAQPGTVDEHAALDRAVADCGRLGVRVGGEPWILDAEVGKITARVLDVLRELRPLRVRTLDPDPARVSFDEQTKLPVIAEPPLRGSVARATIEAARTLQRESGIPVFVLCHRAGVDPRLGAHACMRYPQSARWLTKGSDGLLSAYLPSAAGVLRWTERPEADRWSGPELLEVPGLLPGVTVVQDASGYVHLIGLRRVKRGDGHERVEVVHSTQYQTGRPLGPWHSAGNPNANDRHRAREVGFPSVAFDAQGNMHVFVRNFGHGVSTRKQSPDGKWGAWQHLRGIRVADELAALPGRLGGVELWARTRDSAAAVRWHQEAPGGEWAEEAVLAVSPYPGSLSAAPEAGTVRYRYSGTNEVCVWVPGASPVSLGGADGEGPVGAAQGVGVQGWECTVVVRSGRDGACAVGAHADGRPHGGVWWFDAGEASLVPPAVATDRRGRAIIAVMDVNGRLKVARQEPDANGLAFGAWSDA